MDGVHANVKAMLHDLRNISYDIYELKKYPEIDNLKKKFLIKRSLLRKRCELEIIKKKECSYFYVLCIHKIEDLLIEYEKIIDE